eukprot:GHVU01074242.1.p1 GENE.GHVU01074242.1~~GHVU01074242.1.p1  ORF type:complete len:288 (+),score=20.00 GHVU01074242.1:322-1185(+)
MSTVQAIVYGKEPSLQWETGGCLLLSYPHTGSMQFPDTPCVLHPRFAKALGYLPEDYANRRKITIKFTIQGRLVKTLCTVEEVISDLFYMCASDLRQDASTWPIRPEHSLMLSDNFEVPSLNKLILFGTMVAICPIPEVVLYFDGASRNNPGEAGYGYYIVNGANKEEVLVRGYGYLGQNVTNNVAEYAGLIEALFQANRIHAQRVHVFGDSELVVKQINGEYKVSSSHLLPLYDKAMKLSRSFESFTLSHIRREENKGADQLADAAIQLKRSLTKYEWTPIRRFYE